MPFYGNVNKAMADAKRIADRFCNTNVTFDSLRREYGISYPTFKRAILTRISESKYRYICKKKQAQGGMNTRFHKGRNAWNKGMKGWFAHGTEATRFQKDHIRGSAARRYKSVGTITIRYDRVPRRHRNRKRKAGLPPWPRNRRRYIKIKDSGPPQSCWIPYARYLWEQKHGIVPSGYFIIHKDGNTMNDCLSNLICVDRKGHLSKIRIRGGDKMLQKRIHSYIKTRRKNRRDKQHKKSLRNPLNKRIIVYECNGCGANYPLDAVPDRCPHCGSFAFIKTQLRPLKLVEDKDMSSLVA